jgi:hypothetical protein
MKKKAVLICFSINSEKFESNYERNKFFRGLYGWKQIITKEKRKYIYRREGLLDEIPHIKIDQSSFIIPESKFEKIIKFFEEWSEKVIWKTFKVLLEESLEEMGEVKWKKKLG